MTLAVVIEPEDGNTAATNGCPVLTKDRMFVVDRGIVPTLRWEMRDAGGQPVDLAGLLNGDEGSVEVRLADALTPGNLTTLDGSFVAGNDNKVEFDLTADLTSQSGLWDIAIGVKNDADELLLINKANLSIERGLFGDFSVQKYGPPSLSDIRMQLRDTMLENSLHELPEFSNQEIIFCLGKPLRNWNETPPPVFRATAANFPYRENWLKAVCGELFAMAATWYTRNRFQAAGGGIQDDALGKAQEYTAASQAMLQQWQQFMTLEKAKISANQFMSSFGSDYR